MPQPKLKASFLRDSDKMLGECLGRESLSSWSFGCLSSWSWGALLWPHLDPRHQDPAKIWSGPWQLEPASTCHNADTPSGVEGWEPLKGRGRGKERSSLQSKTTQAHSKPLYLRLSGRLWPRLPDSGSVGKATAGMWLLSFKLITYAPLTSRKDLDNKRHRNK